MVEVTLVILLALFLLGFVHIPGVNIQNFKLFVMNHHTITLYEVLIVIVAFGLLMFLPRFMRIIVGALLIIWIISTLGIIMVNGLPAISIIILLLVVTFHRSFHWYGHYRRRRYD
ncbi:MAG: hypothetical protein ACR2LN_03315 [Candidatus Levyibacteriota bacterium]